MKHVIIKRFLILLLGFLSFSLTAQEQITNVVGSGSSKKYVFQTYLDKKYMLSFDKFDNITTYEMSADSIHFMHSRKIEGSKEVWIGKTAGKFLLLENSKASVAYNFVDDEVKSFEYGIGVQKSYWDARHSDDQVLLFHSSGLNNLINLYYVDLRNGIEDTLQSDLSVFGITEDFIFGRKINSDSISYDCVSYNKSTQIYQTLFTFPQVTKRYYFINGQIIYDDLSRIYAYNLETGEHTLIYEHEKEFRSLRIFEIGDHIALSFRNKANSQAELYDFKLINLNDFSIQSITINDDIRNVYPNLVQGKIIYDEPTQTVIHDLVTDERTTIKTNTNSQYYIADAKYLVHVYYDTLRVVDIFTKKELPHTVPITFESSFFSIKAIKIEDKYIFNIYNSNENDRKLFQVDISNQIVSNYAFEPYAPNGLTIKSNIVLNDSTLFLLDKDLYLIEGKEYTKLNTNPIGEMRYQPYRIADGILYWIEDNSTNLDLLQYSALGVSKVGSIIKSASVISYPPNLVDFAVIDGDIYYIEGYNDANLYKIKGGTTKVERIDNVDAPTSPNQLMIHHGNLYYAKGATVWVILPDETIHNTYLRADPASRFEKIILNNEMFFVNDNALVRLDGKDFNVIAEMEVRGGLNFPITKINNSHILILKEDKTYDIFDGISLKKTTLPANVLFYLTVSEKYILASKLESTAVYKSYLYDYNQNITVPLPDSISSLFLIKIFNYFGKNIIIAKKGIDPFSKILMFEMSDDLQSYQLIKSIDVTGSNLKFNFEQFQNEGLIYVGDKIFIMDENLNLNELEYILGDPSLNKIILKDGYFYFIALHPISGRQLFRIQPISLRTSTNDPKSSFTSVNIYPNPTSQEIYFEGEHYLNAEIYDLNGSKVSQASIDHQNRLEVSNLKNGTYILILTSRNGIKSVGKFIKID